MKRLLPILLCVLYTCTSFAQGIPFIRYYSAQDYNGHNINFDIKAGMDGTVFDANFEGLLYYDFATWRIIHSPNSTRVTVTYSDKNGTIWVGGYNYIGRIDKKQNGELYLKKLSDKLIRGEVLEIWESNGELYLVDNNGRIYQVKNDSIIFKKKVKVDNLQLGLTAIVEPETIENMDKLVVLTDTTQQLFLGHGLKAFIKRGQGLSITSTDNHELYSITDKNGIATNNVTWISHDYNGLLWGASENGIFSIAIPSMYSRFTAKEGLIGDVLSIVDYENHKYVGTTSGLFRLDDMSFNHILGINHACWDIIKTSKGLIAATANGIYLVSSGGQSKQLTTASATALLNDGTQYYSGEMDGVYLTQIATGRREKVCNLERATQIIKDSHGTIWIQSLYGEIWKKAVTEKTFSIHKITGSKESIATLVQTSNKVEIIKAEDTVPFPYPLFSFTDDSGVTWLTNHEGKGIYRWKDGKRLTDLDDILYPLSKTTVVSVFIQGKEIWLGTDEGIIIINTNVRDPFLQNKSKMLIRSITLGKDSIIWGGYGDMPEELPDLNSDSRNLYFTFALNRVALVGETLYRYRLNESKWSAWSTSTDVEFVNMSHGSHTFEVQALDAFGRESDIAAISFFIEYPFYMRWYMLILYQALVAFLIYKVIQFRLRRLEREKVMLEEIVEERTAEVKRAQDKLINQERLATVGKLTQGLIDRILNPINYINNFSKLSEGLVKDIETNIENEKDNMDSDNYDDTVEVLGMLKGNLQKVGVHGQNTTRTLKAMEEMLKDRTGGIIKTDITKILEKDEEMLATYYAKPIQEHHIRLNIEYPQQIVFVKANPELLSKVFMSIFGNSMYAVIKKAKNTNYQPEVSLKAIIADKRIIIKIYDNGTGIEEKIINKVFDPFFTTKTTSEASGTGLYLSHDIIQNYGGDITVTSVKDEFTEFVITLPIIKE